MRVISAEKKNLKQIVFYLKNGQILVLPTDTVYGLVCDATNEKAVGKIFKIKNREKTKPLAVFIKDMAMAKKFAIIVPSQINLLKKSWPGPVTFILKSKNRIGVGHLSELTMKNGTIGLRIPNCRLLNMILNEFGKPLAQTSANVSGQPASTKIKEVLEQLESQDVQPDVIINAGDLPVGRPSKVIDLSKGDKKVLRK